MPLVKTLRTLLTNNIPEILPEIRMAISGLFDQMHESHPVVKGKDGGKSCQDGELICVFRSQDFSLVLNGSGSCRLYQCAGIFWNGTRYLDHCPSLALKMTGSAQNKIFLKSAIDFIEKTLLIAEVVRLLPSSIAP